VARSEVKSSASRVPVAGKCWAVAIGIAFAIANPLGDATRGFGADDEIR
jgi:hypothetical protein